ncbi:MAG: (d)CMP kinase [Defluviitaleaceae bacterium]|nr:(d)CMP kinase [Defluviitaleaceae bacterium]
MKTPTTGFAIAIDGPVGVGKSTTAKLVARLLNMTYIDTGAMYRAVALHTLRTGEPPEQSISNLNIELHHENGTQKIYLNNENITDAIRTQEISEFTSAQIATNELVRKKLVTLQQQIAKNNSVVMDGRDISSQVLPWAQLKIYLDAAPEIRARRRTNDLLSRGQPADFSQVLQETLTRDHRDKNRPISPLIQTPDAIYIDTADMTIQEVAEKIASYAISTTTKGAIPCSTAQSEA